MTFAKSNCNSSKNSGSISYLKWHKQACVTVHTAGRIQEHADEDVNSNNNI